jgi:hypothetical protein
MSCFHNFTAPLWELFSGNLLFLFCSLFYLVWWIVAFRPNSSGGSSGGVFIMFAFITGIAALVLMSVGVNALARDSKALPVRFILLGAVALYLILLPVTAVVFHRQVTSELIIMLIWAALELSVITVLYGTGRFGVGRTALAVTIVCIATVIGLICYLLYYRLDGASNYIDGMIPLATDAVVMAAFLGILAFS